MQRMVLNVRVGVWLRLLMLRIPTLQPSEPRIRCLGHGSIVGRIGCPAVAWPTVLELQYGC